MTGQIRSHRRRRASRKGPKHGSQASVHARRSTQPASRKVRLPPAGHSTSTRRLHGFDGADGSHAHTAWPRPQMTADHHSRSFHSRISWADLRASPVRTPTWPHHRRALPRTVNASIAAAAARMRQPVRLVPDLPRGQISGPGGKGGQAYDAPPWRATPAAGARPPPPSWAPARWPTNTAARPPPVRPSNSPTPQQACAPPPRSP